MSYITSYVRTARGRRRNIRIESVLADLHKDASSIVESTPSNSRVFQIDFETWHARLAGWNPIPARLMRSMKRFKSRNDKVKKAA